MVISVLSIIYSGNKEEKGGFVSKKRKKDQSLIKGKNVASKMSGAILCRGCVC